MNKLRFPFGRITIECVSCHHTSNRTLVHKKTGAEFHFCSKCEENGFYNKEIFEVKDEHNFISPQKKKIEVIEFPAPGTKEE